MNLSNIIRSVINQKQIINQPVQALNNNHFLTKGSLLTGGIGGGVIEPPPPPPTDIDDPDSDLTTILDLPFVYAVEMPSNRPNFSLFSSRPRLKLGSNLSGKITAGSVSIGSTKGLASSKRILTHCTQTSGDIQFCASQIIPSTPVVQPEVLFNTSSFDRYNIPEKYKKGLLTAIQRWGKFIKYNPETIKLIRQNLNNNNWSGLELTGFELVTTGDFYAETETFFAKDNTALVSSFTLKIRDDLIKDFSQADINEIFTHEIGHALGFTAPHNGPFPLPLVRQNAQENGAELLPNIMPMMGFNNTTDNTTPFGLHIQYYSNTVKAYRTYGGNRKYSDGNYDTKITTPFMLPITQDLTGGLHLSALPFYSEKKFGNTQTPLYVKLGFDNEVMLPELRPGKKYYISDVSIGVLLDLYTNLNGKNYPTYIRKGTNSEVGFKIEQNGLIYFGE